MGIERVSSGSYVRICTHASRIPVTRGELGALYVGGPPTITKYLQQRDKDLFYADENGDWLVSGDNTVMDETGTIFVLRRFKDRIKINSVNYSLGLIEGAIQEEEHNQSKVEAFIVLRRQTPKNVVWGLSVGKMSVMRFCCMSHL
jgi:acyl-CoA synthetase (AMP-forming)/AMP-acid ligase II